MASLEVVRSELADAHKDTRLNLQAVLEGGTLTPEQRWGVAVGSAYAARNERLKEAMINEAK
jgi:alkyl hydroperoxide reductase subunit D